MNSLAVIIDDHALFRGGLRLLLHDELGIESVLEAGDFDEALAAISEGLTPDLVTVDLTMPGLSGIEGLAAVIEAFPTARVVVISASRSRSDILGALGAGAHGFVPKAFTSGEIADAIARIVRGELFVPFALSPARGPESVTSGPGDTDRPITHPVSLTPRQAKVLEQLMTGSSTRKIADALNLAEGTVKIHLAAIYRVVGVHSRAEAISKLKSLNST